MIDDVERRFRAVLTQLALTSNGATTSWASSGVTDRDYTPRLGTGDAPQIELARAWENAAEDERDGLVEQAEQLLQSIRYSRADPSAEETKAARDQRIVEQGEGIPARDVAVWGRCGIGDVRRARAAAGRDLEFGRLPRNGHELSPSARRGEVQRLAGEGMSARQISVVLKLSYSTVRRDLGRC